ncbi:GNAT family N-acetyltransferase [Nocardia sp. NEAU-G5]|uniref:GNAT family N-acetyltransferase n=1 Tax=Nocardia albiluteola TaxID=2842303 RepID=A0ABS6B5D5_9NOCA|nr:GNAT family N-acetyltransferase [Nocardia albiluteola]MBU3064423.1 GNAT family N-acetyltransferase [Nocardia albiluteola]
MAYRLGTDSAVLDFAVVWRHLSTETYWSRGRTLDQVEDEFTTAWRVVTAHESTTGMLAGFARAISDGIGSALLADVFVASDHRRRGLGKLILNHMIDAGPGREFGWILFTHNAHKLYEEFGFERIDSLAMIRLPGPPGRDEHRGQNPIADYRAITRRTVGRSPAWRGTRRDAVTTDEA